MTKFPDEPVVDFSFSKKIYKTIFIFSLVWVILILMAPVLSASGDIYDKVSSMVYVFFSKVCHQSDTRSFHILEHKLGVCSRCTMIYISFFLGTCIYPIRYKLNNIIPPSIWFLAATILLLLMDVTFDSVEIIHNSFTSRSITGFLVGFILPFYIIPGFVKFFYEVNSYFRNKASA